MRFSKLLALVAWTLLSSIPLATAQTILDRQPRPTKPDAQGRNLYVLELSVDAVEGVDARDEPVARNPMDPANRTDFRGWHRPKVRALVRRLESEYGIDARTMTSHALPSFSAYIREQVLDTIRRDPRVAKVLPTFEALDFSQVPPWTDQDAGNELIPWGKTAVGANDALSTGNIVYMIDGGMPSANNDLLNIVPSPVNDGLLVLQAHASHVAGILSAAMNSAQVRGVNPGATIVNVNRGLEDPDIQQALDWVLADSEARGIFAVANISSNSDRWRSGHVSGLARYVQRLSNRVLVVQSAGNQHLDACDFAYGPAVSNDGILVVGGIDDTGRQGLAWDNTHVGYTGGGSNTGLCVEMWAPATRVWSTWNTGVLATQFLSGTSMAAPHVAALAARFGTSATTPVERESHVRARLRNTGFNDDQGAVIVVPSYVQPPSIAVPVRLWNLSAQADPTATGSTASAHDGLYGSTSIWSSGHSAPAWIEFDLIYPRTLKSIRLSPEQSPFGAVVHQIHVGNTTPPTTLAQTVSGSGESLVPLAADLNAVGRYVRVLTTTSPSWVAWREVEIYATVRADETAIDWFYLGLLNRAADAGGCVYYLGQLRSARCSDPNSVHGTLNAITAGFINSPEFQARGLLNEAYVTALYKGLLRRDPDPAGLAYHTNELNAGATRESIRLNFVASPEFAGATVAPVMSESCMSI